MSETEDIPSQISIRQNGDLIKLEFNGIATDWISKDDSFIRRIQTDRINRFFFDEHLTREFEMKGILDDGIDLFNSQRYAKAIGEFDRVIYYDDAYTQALLFKSHALFSQGHYVKALRFYKRSGFEDKSYYRSLLDKSSEERQDFPKIKQNIYAGDEAASVGEYEKAVGFYDRALANPSKFKNKILFKLLNKKAICLVKLERFDEALASFEVSIGVHENDLAYFGKGYCQHMLDMDCLESLKRAENIDKKYLLVRARIFNEYGCYSDASESLDVFLNNHFTIDSAFKSAVEAKVAALEGLGLDTARFKAVLNELK